MFDVRDLRATIVPKSDQLNAEQRLNGPLTITVTDVRVTESAEQPVVIHYAGEDGRPYKPCKTMRKLLVFAWGQDGSQWSGKSMTLYNRQDVQFGGVKVGGIRISHLSHIDRDISVSLTATRGKKAEHAVKVLKPEAAKPATKRTPDTRPAARAQRLTEGVKAGAADVAALSASEWDQATLEAVWALLDDKTINALTAAWPKAEA